MRFFNLHRLAVCVLACALYVLGATGASAHAVLLSTAPAENAVVETAPATFVLSFNEPVSLLAASVIAPDGEQIDVSEGARNGAELSIVLPADLGQGTHVLSWRVVSVDGHPIGGAAVFSIGIITGAAFGETASDPVVSALLWASKTVLYAALFFGPGMAVFNALVAAIPHAPARMAAVATVAGLLAAPISLGLQGVDALGLGLAEIASARTWSTGLATSYGWTAIVCFAAVALAGLSLRIARGRLSAILAIAAWIAAPLALVLSGHASAAYPQWLTRPAVFLHIAGIVFWVGALVPLFVLLRQPGHAAARPLARFSAAIPLPVAAILVSGIALAAVQLGPDTAHWLSPYGVILACKRGLLVILLGLAVWNRLALSRPALAGDARAMRRLKSSIGIEIVLVLVILGLVAGWRFTPPPRALAEAAAVPISMHIHTDRAMADITIEPGRAGANRLSIFLMDGEFVAVEPMEVGVAVSVPDLGIEASQVSAVLGDDGLWRVDDLMIPVAGTWRLDLEIRLSRFDLVRLSETFTLP
jgi:copper transport protein